jgi:amidase
MSKISFRKPSRRNFVKSSIGAGFALAVAPALSGARAFAWRADKPADTPEFEFHEATVADLQSAMESGKLAARSLAEKYLTRIEALDKNGPNVNSVIEVNPDAVAIADQLDAERKSKGARGPLHGIPVMIKDNIDTHDGMQTTAGSLALVGSKPVRDSFVVQQLRKSGAVILGKTNLSEWANIRSSHSISGWSGRGGLTRNP